MRVIVTRPAAQAVAWVEDLRSLGLDAQALPLIDIGPAHDLEPVRDAWRQLAQTALVVFVSANAVNHFFAARPGTVQWPAGLNAGSTGPGTSGALRAAGVAEVIEPAADAAQFDSEALWERLSPQPWAGRKVLVVRGSEGRDWLAQQLGEQGAEVEFVAAYRRLPPTLDVPQRQLLAAAQADPGQHLWLLSSSEAVRHLQALAPVADWSASRAWASHPRIAQAARRAGFGRVELVVPDPAAVARRLEAD